MNTKFILVLIQFLMGYRMADSIQQGGEDSHSAECLEVMPDSACIWFSGTYQTRNAKIEFRRDLALKRSANSLAVLLTPLVLPRTTSYSPRTSSYSHRTYSLLLSSYSHILQNNVEVDEVLFFALENNNSYSNREIREFDQMKVNQSACSDHFYYRYNYQ